MVDPQGDYQIEGQAAPTGFETLDLLSLDLRNTSTSIVFSLEVGRILNAGDSNGADDPIYDIRFELLGQPLGVRITYASLGSSEYSASLTKFDPTRNEYINIDDLALTVDAGPRLLHAEVTIEQLEAALENTLVQGDLIQHWRVTSGFVYNLTINEYPDGGDTMQGDLPYASPIGDAGSETLKLSTPQRIRPSNGEATTILFPINITNKAAQTDTVSLTVDGLPEQWRVNLPSGSFRIEANKELTIPVLVTIPFAHAHGVLESFQLEALSSSTGEAASIDIGIDFLEVAVVSGHHPILFLHSQDPRTMVMTTEQDWDGATNEDIDFARTSFNGGRTAYAYEAIEVPMHTIGLQWDQGLSGTLETTFTSRFPLQDVQIEASLHLGSQRVASGTQAAGSWQANAPNDLTFELEPTTPDIKVDAARDDLKLRVTVSATGSPPAMPPLWHSGGQMTLPLREYHDDVNEEFSSLTGLSITSTETRNRLVNPGNTAAFSFQIDSDRTQDAEYTITVSGALEEWANVLPVEPFTIEAFGTGEGVLAVTVPEDAVDATRSEFFVQVIDTNDPSLSAAIRFAVVVDDDEEHPDESHVAQKFASPPRSKESPGQGAILTVLTCLATGLCVVRRRAWLR